MLKFLQCLQSQLPIYRIEKLLITSSVIVIWLLLCRAGRTKKYSVLCYFGTTDCYFWVPKNRMKSMTQYRVTNRSYIFSNDDYFGSATLLEFFWFLFFWLSKSDGNVSWICKLIVDWFFPYRFKPGQPIKSLISLRTDMIGFYVV